MNIIWSDIQHFLFLRIRLLIENKWIQNVKTPRASDAACNQQSN